MIQCNCNICYRYLSPCLHLLTCILSPNYKSPKNITQLLVPYVTIACLNSGKVPNFLRSSFKTSLTAILQVTASISPTLSLKTPSSQSGYVNNPRTFCWTKRGNRWKKRSLKSQHFWNTKWSQPYFWPWPSTLRLLHCWVFRFTNFSVNSLPNGYSGYSVSEKYWTLWNIGHTDCSIEHYQLIMTFFVMYSTNIKYNLITVYHSRIWKSLP